MKLLAAMTLAVLTDVSNAAVRFVSPDGTAEATGASWAQAKSLDAALSAAKAGDELWLKAGTYAGGVTISAGVKVLGGFAGTESAASARRFAAESVISGGTVVANVTAASGTVVFDNVTVTGGTRRGLAATGGGVSLVCTGCRFVDNRSVQGNPAWNAAIVPSYGLCGRALAFIGTGTETLTVTDCVFSGNGEARSPEMSLQKVDCRGLALFVSSCTNATITGTTFSGNGLLAPDTQTFGGGSDFISLPGFSGAGFSVVHLLDTRAAVSSSIFAGNRTGVSAGRGGQIVCVEGAASGSTFGNCVWKGNDSRYQINMFQSKTPTAAMFYGPLVVKMEKETDRVSLDGCTFAYNLAFGGYTAGLNVQTGTATVRSSTFWGNVMSTVYSMHADLQTGYKGIIDIDTSLLKAMDNRLFDLTDPRIRFGSAMKVGDPDFATQPATIVGALKCLGTGAKKLVDLNVDEFPFAGRNANAYDGAVQARNVGAYMWYDRARFDPATIDLARGANASEPAAGARTLTTVGDPDGENDYAKKTLAIAPEPIYCQPWYDNTRRREDWDCCVGAKMSRGRPIQFYRHTADPDWHTDDWSAAHRADGLKQCDTFAVAQPTDTVGANEQRPLVVILHSRGGSSLAHGVDDAAISSAASGGPGYVPDNSYALFLDCMENHKYDFWWGAMPPPAYGVKAYSKTYYSFYVAPTGMNGELFWGPTEKPFTCAGKPDITNLDYLRRGESACEKRVMDTIEWAVRKYNIDRNRIYLAGNSMGGQGTLGIGLPHGDVFAALHANVPATIWFAATRMGFVDNRGKDVAGYSRPKFEPPFCLDWSGSNDAWSRDHDVMYRNMAKNKFAYLGYWGDYGHIGDYPTARTKNDLVGTFDYFTVVKNESYPVFTRASTDDKLPWPQAAYVDGDRGSGEIKVDKYGHEITKGGLKIREGSDLCGQVNAWFRWDVKSDTAAKYELELKIGDATEIPTAQWARPTVSFVDITPRRLQRFKPTTGKVRWISGAYSGVTAIDPNLGVYTVAQIPVTQTPATLVLTEVSASTPESRKEPGISQ